MPRSTLSCLILARISHAAWCIGASDRVKLVLRERVEPGRRGSPMPTHCSATGMAFGRVGGRDVVAEFDGGRVTSLRALLSRTEYGYNDPLGLALQLQEPAFEVSLLCGGLMSAPPSRPSNDEGWLNAPLRQSDRDAPDFLHRPGNRQAWR